jgi:uncharacterized repeat protein (TIGR02543 family)
MHRSVQSRRPSLFITALGALLLSIFIFASGSFSASASVASVIDDGSNSSGWTNDVRLKDGVGNPGSAFTFDKNSLIMNTFGASGADFDGSSIKFDIVFNASNDYLSLWWGRGVNVGTGTANALIMGPAGNPNSTSTWMNGKIGLVSGMSGPCPYYCASALVSSDVVWEANRWYTVEVKILTNSTSYYIDDHLIQSIPTSLPVSNFVTFGGDDRNGYGFSDGVYVDNISITPPPSYPITYDVSGSTDLAPVQSDVLGGDTFIVASGVNRALYNFVGWSDGVTVYQPGDTYTVASSGVALTATWEKKTYEVNFDSQGGSEVSSATFNNVDAFVEPSEPTKPGYTFAGWSRTIDSEAIGDQTVLDDTTAITLYAVWGSNSAELTFNSNGGSSVENVIFQIGEAISSSPADPVRPGYIFDGWKLAADESAVLFPYSPVLTKNYAMSVSAANLTDNGSYVNVGRWNSNTWYGPSRPENHPRDVVTYRDGLKYVAIRESKNTILSNPERLDEYYLIPLETSTTLTAYWTAQSHQVTYELAAGISVAPIQPDVLTDATFTVADEPQRPGFTFDGWFDGTNNFAAGDEYVVGVDDITLTAQWSVITHKITYALSGGTSLLPTQADTGTEETFVVATAPSRSGYTFTGWFDGTNTFAPGDEYVVGDGEVTLTATWSQNPSRLISFAAGGGSGSDPSSAPSTLLSGESFNLPANLYVKTGFDFAGWSDGSSSYPVGTTIVIGASDLNFVAVWTEKAAVVPHGTRSYTITGFKFEKSNISNSMFVKLRTWLNANRNVTQITCTGYTGFNQNKLTPSQLATLGKNRAVNVCNYLKKLRPSLVVKIAKPVTSNSKNPASRKVVIVGKY